MLGALKLGVAATVGYAVGGKVGSMAIDAVMPSASPDVKTGAMWAGRLVTFVVTSALLGR